MGSHPYDHAELTRVEQSSKPELLLQDDLFLNSWNPPWLILLFVPSGRLPFPISASVRILCNIVLIGLALILSQQMSTGIESSRGILFVFAVWYLFGITIAQITVGQITMMILLGILGSIWLINR